MGLLRQPGEFFFSFNEKINSVLHVQFWMGLHRQDLELKMKTQKKTVEAFASTVLMKKQNIC